MQIICSSEDWSQVTEFWNSVLGMHDAVLTDAQNSKAAATLTLGFQDVLTHDPSGGFRLLYPKVQLLLSGVEVSQARRVTDAVGNDIVAAELLPNELWVNTMAGSFTVAFSSLRFVIP
jgi:hypothetical protein